MSIYDYLEAKRQADKASKAYSVLSGGAAPKRALALRDLICKAAASLTDQEALDGMELFPAWMSDGAAYSAGDRVRFGDRLFRCLQDHCSQPAWTPTNAPSLWARVSDPDEAWPAWVQPLGSEDAYPAGAKVSHNGSHWTNTYGDGNIWEPGVFGWEEAA
jgi:hypothetical protein